MDDHHHDCLYTVCACVCICMVFVFPRSAAVMTPLKWRAVKSGHRRSEYLYYPATEFRHQQNGIPMVISGLAITATIHLKCR